MNPAPLLGWPLLPLPDANGQVHWPSLEQSVAQQIRVILQTRPGEQLMRPTYGAGLENFRRHLETADRRTEFMGDVAEEALLAVDEGIEAFGHAVD